MSEEKPADGGKGPRCPMCGKPREPRFRPFCSKSCRDRDLMNWLDGRYAVPAAEVDDDGKEGFDPSER
ncbi:MAG: DNA gyrase inhibitor YacG [Geminicoccaceae bacterium]